MRRHDIEFASGGLTCRGWLYEPAGGDERAPAIVMSHGFAAVKEQGLAQFAEAFAATGFAVLVFDYRYLGASDGADRGRIIAQEQHDDAVLSPAIALKRFELIRRRNRQVAKIEGRIHVLELLTRALLDPPIEPLHERAVEDRLGVVVDTRNWLPGSHVLISTDWVDRVSWEERGAYIALTRDEVRSSPEYDPASFTEAAEDALHRHYGRPQARRSQEGC